MRLERCAWWLRLGLVSVAVVLWLIANVRWTFLVQSLMILWVSASHADEFRRTHRPRSLVAAIVTVPAALLLLGLAFTR
jgi:hypothetical protein